MQSTERTYFGEPDDFVTVRHLTIQGTNYQIGHKLGELAVERYHRSPADFTADPPFAAARRAYLKRNYPVQWERVRGVAGAFGLDSDDDGYDFTNLMYNVDVPLPAPGCSVVYYPPSTTANGRGYLSRNYDFSIGTVADVLQLPLPPGAGSRGVPVMSEPYLMEWYPEDGGYASLAIQAFDALSGTLDGINSAGLVVSILADEEAIAELGPGLEIQIGSPRAVGLHELQVMRLLLDTCATTAEAKEALLTTKQYYQFVPCHYIIADRAGNSFVYENSTGRNVQHIIDGRGLPQVITNFQLHKHPSFDRMPHGPLSLETNAFWRYQTLVDRISEQNRLFTPDDLKANNRCVNILRLFEELHADPSFQSIAAGIQARTLWHSLYDQQARSVEFSFYLGEVTGAAGTRTERRSDYVTFALRL
jgi:hypothetical protein